MFTELLVLFLYRLDSLRIHSADIQIGIKISNDLIKATNPIR